LVVLPVNLVVISDTELKYRQRLNWVVLSNCTVEKAIQQTDPIYDSDNTQHLFDHVWCAYLCECFASATEATALNDVESPFFVWSRLFEPFNTVDADAPPDTCMSPMQFVNQTFAVRLNPDANFKLRKSERETPPKTHYWCDFKGAYVLWNGFVLFSTNELLSLFVGKPNINRRR